MKRIFSILTFLLLTVIVYAQFSGFNLKSPNQQFVEQAIRDGLFVVKQTYQLEDTTTNQRFGRYGNEEFGMDASLAIRLKDGYIVNSNLLTPWMQDANFERYRGTHRPILSRSVSIELRDSTLSPFNLSVDSLRMVDNRLSLISSTDTLISGFGIKTYKHPVEGWFVWVANDSTVNEYSGRKKPELTIFKRTVEFMSDSVSYEVEAPNITNNVWGGIFIVPEQTEIGQITFYLSGVLLKGMGDNRWNLVVPLIEDRLIIPHNADNELTPLTSVSSKKKKNKKRK